MRLRYIVKQMAEKRIRMCERSPHPYRCREWIRTEERRALMRIASICPYLVCKHIGYCERATNDDVESESSLDRKLYLHVTQICGDFEQMQAMCAHIVASNESHRYAEIYMAILHNDSKWIEDDLRKQMPSTAASRQIDLCGTCKSAVQSSTDFYLQVLVSCLLTVEE
jgi:hypothetical protein